MNILFVVGHDALCAAITDVLSRHFSEVAAVESRRSTEEIHVANEGDRALIVYGRPCVSTLAPAAQGLLKAIPYAVLSLEPQSLRFGPVFVPGKSPCWHCWQWRRVQAGRAQERHLAILNYYDDISHPSPAGWLDAFALIAAPAIVETLVRPAIGELSAGSLWEMHFASRRVRRSMCIGVHGCPQCGRMVNTATRSQAKLEMMVKELWSEVVMEE